MPGSREQPARRFIRAYGERRPMRDVFRISRAAFTEGQMVVAEIHQDGLIGRGECEPHESEPAALESAVAEIEALQDEVAAGLSRQDLLRRLPPGPVRNAIDCALWDIEAKRTGRRAHETAGIEQLRPVHTVFTLGIDAPEAMAAKALAMAPWPRFKIKLGGSDPALDLARVKAVQHARQDAEIIVDANGAWSMDQLGAMSTVLAQLGVALIEQPLAPGEDLALTGFASPVPLCADESCLDRSSLSHVIGRYQYINIKLDKTGGLTEALALADAAEAADLGLMVGCMNGTSLAMAPAFLVAQRARFVDLDGPLLLATDQPHGMRYDGGLVYPPDPALWG